MGNNLYTAADDQQEISAVDWPRPLALYLCSYGSAIQQTVLERTHAEGVCLNGAAACCTRWYTIGYYHGDEGFLLLSFICNKTVI